ncbi:glutamine amidotransferase [Granulosicoccus sp. 3-233]|uniref:glutamine amidotransferase n=1 Tax=Granulosicoccus sp. 3-233 TaxID=3417969 RepID=UPI003D328627
MKPFLILQLRPETAASDDEFNAILDKGGLSVEQARRIRLDQEYLPQDLSLDDYSGVIVGGGPGCVSDAEHGKSAMDKQIESAVLGLMPQITETDFPFLGCCYGIGILAHHLGATVSKEQYGEAVGAVECELTQAGRQDPILDGVDERFRAFVGHKEAVQHLPEGCEHLAQSEPCPYQMIRYRDNVYATQFHPEADGNSFEVRIQVYRNAGYFPPEEAQKLVDMCRAEDIRMPERILTNFVRRYKRI